MDRQDAVIETAVMIRAVILDLDGLLSRNTAQLHCRAWKLVFDRFMEDYGRDTGAVFDPMDPQRDYRAYIEGRPRYEGAEAFLESRSIHLPFGKPDDDSSMITVCGLGNRKNGIFLALLKEHGSVVDENTVNVVKKWRSEHKKTGIVSMSRNCRSVLSSAGISGLFDLIFDGEDVMKNNLVGKPSPDIYLFVASLLGVQPFETAVVESTSSGIKAGKEGRFGYIVGITRESNPAPFYEAGADIVVSSPSEIVDLAPWGKRRVEFIPSALDHFEEIWVRSQEKRLFLVFDYDGTLTPITANPETAVLPEKMRRGLRTLSELVKVAVVSGRDLNDLKSRVGIEELFYAGSHGFDIQGPGGTRIEPREAQPMLPELDRVEREIRMKLSGAPGLHPERKLFMFAVHFRQAAEEEIRLVRKVFSDVVEGYSRLMVTEGKMVIEARPAIEWHAGKAVVWMTDHFFEQGEPVFPVYVGDDIADEDAFKEIRGWGCTVLVNNHTDRSYAGYRLSGPDEVLKFIYRIYEKIRLHSVK